MKIKEIEAIPLVRKLQDVFQGGTYKITKADAGKKFSDIKPAKLTDYKDGLSSYSLSPDGSRIILAYAAGGNENTQIAILETATGTITPIHAATS